MEAAVSDRVSLRGIGFRDLGDVNDLLYLLSKLIVTLFL